MSPVASFIFPFNSGFSEISCVVSFFLELFFLELSVITDSEPLLLKSVPGVVSVAEEGVSRALPTGASLIFAA